MIIDINPNYTVVENKPYREGLPELIEKGFTGFTIADYIENFVDAIKNNKTEKIRFFLDDKNRSYWDSVDSCPHYDGTFIVRPNSANLLSIKPKTELVHYALPLTKEGYQELGKRFGLISRNKPGLILNTELTAEQFGSHGVWNKLLQGNQVLQNEAAECLYKYYKEEKGLTKLFGVYLPSDQENPEERAWYLRNLVIRPFADARDNLDYDARFFGWRAQNLETKIE